MKIVSANYLDRKSKKRWLVRDEKDDPQDAEAHQEVVLTGVRFGRAPIYEQGFGCSIVAFAETATPTKGKPNRDEVRLTFDWNRFVDGNGNTVATCDSLRLTSDGKMYATRTPATATAGATTQQPATTPA